MVIQIRGTGGAGKSHIVRAAMEMYEVYEPLLVPNRIRPLGNICRMTDEYTPPGRKLFVPGHYETACGGCDTIKTTDEVYRLVDEYHEKGFDVLHEGIMVSDDTRRAVEFDGKVKREHDPQRTGFVVIHLDPPIELCLAGIQARRDAKGNSEVLNPKNTVERAKRIKRHCVRLRDAGVRVLRFTDRQEAKVKVLELLGLEQPQEAAGATAAQ